MKNLKTLFVVLVVLITIAIGSLWAIPVDSTAHVVKTSIDSGMQLASWNVTAGADGSYAMLTQNMMFGNLASIEAFPVAPATWTNTVTMVVTMKVKAGGAAVPFVSDSATLASFSTGATVTAMDSISNSIPAGSAGFRDITYGIFPIDSFIRVDLSGMDPGDTAIVRVCVKGFANR